MDVNAQEIKKLRTSSAYTQQHLADACNISLRTIQRVERYGVASSETLMSLSSVFEVDAQSLIALPEPAQIIEESSNISQSQNIVTIVIAVTAGIIVGTLTTYFVIS